MRDKKNTRLQTIERLRLKVYDEIVHAKYRFDKPEVYVTGYNAPSRYQLAKVKILKDLKDVSNGYRRLHPFLMHDFLIIIASVFDERW